MHVKFANGDPSLLSKQAAHNYLFSFSFFLDHSKRNIEEKQLETCHMYNAVIAVTSSVNSLHFYKPAIMQRFVYPLPPFTPFIFSKI